MEALPLECSRCLLAFTFLLTAMTMVKSGGSLTLSSKLIHRFSQEATSVHSTSPWRRIPRRRSLEYYSELIKSDVQRQRMKLRAQYQSLLFTEGSQTFSLGNDFGWLHYTWVDIGTPNVSFLVALDVGSDLFWVPCDCIQCAPIAGQNYSLGRGLNTYSPAKSVSSKHLLCSDELCDGGSKCKSQKQFCPYMVDYYSAGTSSSGLLVQDKLYLSAGNSPGSKAPIEATVVVGCGNKQNGEILSGVAPDGLMGLGFGNISVPSFLSKAGLVRDSFSICFQEDDSGRIVFGDQGIPTQHSTPFIPLRGKYVTYIVGVEGLCIGKTCLEGSGFQALVDSGSSFTYIPDAVYKRVVQEFDAQVNVSRVFYKGSPWEYCYKARLQDLLESPKLMLNFSSNNKFLVQTPFFVYEEDEGELSEYQDTLFMNLHDFKRNFEGIGAKLEKFSGTLGDTVISCLALQSTGDGIGTIGQNLIRGYRMVFGRENLKLGWSRSNCQYYNEASGNDHPESSLPSNQQPKSPDGHAASPAIAGLVPPAIPSMASSQHIRVLFSMALVLLCWKQSEN